MARENFTDVFDEEKVKEWVEEDVRIKKRFNSKKNSNIMEDSSDDIK